MTDLQTRITAHFDKRGDDMARPVLHVGRSTIIGTREIAAYQACVKLTAQNALARSQAEYPETIKHLGGL